MSRRRKDQSFANLLQTRWPMAPDAQPGTAPTPTPSSEPRKESSTKVIGMARERLLDELEATLDALRAEMELLGPRLRGSRSAARLFLMLDRRARETREVLVAMVDAENATQH